MKRVLACMAVAVAAIALVAADESPAVKTDLAGLQGEWSMVKGQVDGTPLSDEMARMFRRTCHDDVVRVSNGMQLMMNAKITIDPTKTPKTIDYEILDGATKGKKHLGIYQLDGDTLTSCFAAPDAPRPTEFASKSGDQRVFSVWKRQASPK